MTVGLSHCRRRYSGGCDWSGQGELIARLLNSLVMRNAHRWHLSGPAYQGAQPTRVCIGTRCTGRRSDQVPGWHCGTSWATRSP